MLSVDGDADAAVEENISQFRLWQNCLTLLKLQIYLLLYVKLGFITIYKFNCNLSVAISLHSLILTDFF